jgi:mycothiol system anti-sigma-R factor
MSAPDNIACEQALKRLLEFVDRELSDRERASIEHHLRTCRSCYSRMEFESRLKELLSVLSSDDVPQKAVNRIRDLLKEF